MPLSKEGEKLLRKVKKHILEEPLRLRMSSYLLNKDYGYRVRKSHKGIEFYDLSTGWGEPQTQKVPKCGTAGCIAGWCVILGKGESTGNTVETAMQFLGFDLDSVYDSIARHRLFYVSSWSQANRTAYMKAESQEQRAKIAASEIDVFIKEQHKLKEEGK